jgi:acyl carrier protein
MRLEDLFSAVLEIPADALSEETGPTNLKSWDSLRHIKLISAMEEVYGVTFSTAEIKSLKSVGAVRRALTGRGVAA